MPNPCFVTPLNRNILTLTGPDARSFLHALCTNDINILHVNTLMPAALCKPNGRVFTTFHVWASDEETFHLLITDELTEAIKQTLLFYRLRSKVDIQVESTWNLLGIYGNLAENQVPEMIGSLPDPFKIQSHLHGVILGLEKKRWILVTKNPSFITELNVSLAPATEWERLDIIMGWPTLSLRTQNHFMPQHINLDLLSAINFQKGCYPGQEVIARLQYLAHIKKRMFLFHQPVEGHLSAGDPVLFKEDPVGEIVSVEINPKGGMDLLAVVDIEPYQGNGLSTAFGIIEARTLPYRLIEAEETK